MQLARAVHIQSAIAENRKKLGLEDEGLTLGVKVKWTDENTVLSDLQDNNVAVMMRPYESQSKNIAFKFLMPCHD